MPTSTPTPDRTATSTATTTSTPAPFAQAPSGGLAASAPVPATGGPSVVTGIVAAMPEEMAPLRARLTDARRLGNAGFDVVAGRLGGERVVLAVTGDGDRNARLGIAALLRAAPLDRLIAIGVAGALSPELGAGALVVSDGVFREGEGTADAGRADAGLRDLAVRHARARRGVVVTAGRIADTVAEKQRLLTVAHAVAASLQMSNTGSAKEPTSASTPLCAVVDLESAAFATAATRAGIPWIVLRTVSDIASEALPALLNRCRDSGGAVRRGRVAFELLGEPGALPVLLLLRQRVRRAADDLARAAEAVLHGAATEGPPTHRDVAVVAAQGGV